MAFVERDLASNIIFHNNNNNNNNNNNKTEAKPLELAFTNSVFDINICPLL
jgi:hypothetical protein